MTEQANGPDPAVADRDARVQAVMHQSIIVLTACTLGLTVLGVIMVYSAITPGAYQDAGNGGSFRSAGFQTVYAVLGVIAGVVTAIFPLQFYRRYWKWILAAGVLLQVLVFTPLGVAVAGNRNWVALGPVRFQPSEFLKLALIVGLAATVVTVKKPRATAWREIVHEWRWPFFITLLALGSVLAGFDMGTAIIVAMIAVAVLWLGGLSGRFFGVITLLAVLAGALLVAMSPSRLARIGDYFSTLFTMPKGPDPSQADYALWAFGSGGLGGSGLGTGVQKWPGNMAEAQTDFIFAVVGEELGFFGCLVVVLMVLGIGWALLRIARAHPHRFARLLCGGVAMWLCGQALVNMLVVTGLLPVFGVPLPFMSQGGSSVIACLVAVGVALSCALSVPGVRESFRRSPRLASRVRSVVPEEA